MKRYNGFTLIELLGVLILLAVIALITFPIIDKVLSNAKNEAYERQKDSIIEAARMYVTNNGKYDTSQTQLSFQTLIDAGFLKEGEILDPRDSNKEMPGCVIYNWDESKNQYMFEYSENCVVATPAECFTYEDTSVIETFDINYDECVTYMTSNYLFYPSDEIDLLCKGKSVDDETIKNIFNSEYTDKGITFLNELKSNNVIANITETKGIEITGYDNQCGGFAVIIPNSIDNKLIVSIGNRAFYEKSLTKLDISYVSKLQYIEVNSFCFNNVNVNNFIGNGIINYNYAFRCIM